MMELRPCLVWSSTPDFVLAHHASKKGHDIIKPIDTVDQMDMLQVHELRRENRKEVVLYMCTSLKKSSQLHAKSGWSQKVKPSDNQL